MPARGETHRADAAGVEVVPARVGPHPAHGSFTVDDRRGKPRVLAQTVIDAGNRVTRLADEPGDPFLHLRLAAHAPAAAVEEHDDRPGTVTVRNPSGRHVEIEQ